GLRVNEAINFDYHLEHPASEYKGLYLLRGKGSKERYFLKEAKESLNIPNHIELTPHTLRRSFATYNAISGMPLPILQNVLGHANLRTTALYVKARITNEIHQQVKFQGFSGFKDFSEETKMGHCEAPNLTEHWQALDGKKVEVDLEGLIGTIAHELAHAYQFVANLGKGEELSQCESTGERDANGNLLYPGLAAEHTVLTKEIKEMIESSAEYQEFKNHGNTTNKVTYKNREICVDCHHELVRKEHQQKQENQGSQQSKKCAICGKVQDKEDFHLATDTNTGRQLGYYCEPCKEELEKRTKEEEKCQVCGTTENTFNMAQRTSMGSGEVIEEGG
ncbi:5986_t:CDS:2, partial [Scutellospora calospora]